MCRGFQIAADHRLTIKSFTVHLSSSSTSQLPDILTLHYLPCINGAPIEVSGIDVVADSPAYVTLHRARSESVSYATRERVIVCEGTRFEIYVGSVKAVRGVLRKKEEEGWRMDCRPENGVVGVNRAELEVEGVGERVMKEKVEIEVKRMRRRRREVVVLEEIPEVREDGWDVCGCSECGGDEEMDGGDCEMGGVGWAVDVGIWVACIGVGYLVSTAASSKRFRKKRFLV